MDEVRAWNGLEKSSRYRVDRVAGVLMCVAFGCFLLMLVNAILVELSTGLGSRWLYWLLWEIFNVKRAWPELWQVRLMGVIAHVVFLVAAAVRGARELSVWMRVGWALLACWGLSFAALFVLVDMLRSVIPGSISVSGVIAVLVGVPVVALVVFSVPGRDARSYLWRVVWLTAACLCAILACVAWVQLAQGSVWWRKVSMDVFVSYCLVLVLSTLLTLLLSRGRYRRQRQLRESLPFCLRCGYDMTGSFVGGVQVCPECGRAAEAGQLARVGA